MVRWQLTAIGILLSSLCNWGVNAADPTCADACLTLATNFEYAGCLPTDDLYYACRCTSPEFLGTIALCIKSHCNPAEWSWIDEDICQGYGETPPIESFNVVLASATLHATAAPANLSEALTNPILLQDQEFEYALETTSDFTGNMTDSSFFGWLLCMFAGIVCLIGAVQNHILTLFLDHHSSDLEGHAKPRKSAITRYFKKYFLIPPTFKLAHIGRVFYLSIPLRSQTILISTYLVLNLSFLCVDYNLFAENLYWPDRTDLQLTRYVADRSGVLAFAQIPLLIAFAGRNNVLIWLKGWSFSTFNVWHKWIARVCLIQTFIHSVGYTVYAVQEGGVGEISEYYQDAYLRWGAVGTTACFLLCFQAIYIFRRFWYEIFLAMHIILAVVFMVGCWYHVYLLDSGHMEWLYASVAVWAFDRFIRFARLFLLNIAWSKGRVARKAHIQLIAPDTVKAHVNLGYNFTFTPGQYVYVYFSGFKFWESHPFTIARYDVSKDSARQPTLTLLFRKHDGVTRKIAKYLAGGERTLSCYVEGPYGHQLPVDRYNNVHLLAGGVGITAILPYLRFLSAINGNRVRFDWVVRHEDSLKWFNEEISECARNPHVDVHIHVTRTPDIPPVNDGAKGSQGGNDNGKKLDEISVEMDRTSNARLGKYTVKAGRPCLTKLVAGHVAETVGSLAVVACGPDTFVDETRTAVADNVVEANGTVDYFEEAFTW